LKHRRKTSMATSYVARTGALFALVLGLLVLPGPALEAQAQPLDTAFTYQGQLQQNGAPVDDTCDFRFLLYDQPTGGSQIGSTQTISDVQVVAGYFAVALDFGSSVFDGAPRYLDIAVRCGAETDFSVFGERVRLRPTPYALHAGQAPWSGLTDVPAGLEDGDDNTTYSAGTGLTLNDTTLALDTAYANARYWQLGGNTSPLTPTLGTTDSPTLTLVVSDTTALRLGATGDNTPNLLGGAASNSIAAGAYAVVIAGGEGHTASASAATISGGQNNEAGEGGTVGGGGKNLATGISSTVAGGRANAANTQFSAIGGGENNVITGQYATIGGGDNSLASGDNATVGGGQSNEATNDNATIGGGEFNEAQGVNATVGGGSLNKAIDTAATVSGGVNNVANGQQATVGGGFNNIAVSYATVPGGRNNEARAAYSFAAGRDALANHPGAFVWADSSDAVEFASEADYQFRVRATGGVEFVTDTNSFGGATAGVSLAAGGSSWNIISDRRAKTAFAPIDNQSILERVADLPIASWQYRSQDASIRHIGPMAQDFYAAFGLGTGDTTISTVDADGVAFAAIQGLHAQNQEQAEHIADLEAENADLQTQVDDLEARLSALEAALNDSEED
jgi:hypothetical protein